MDNALRQFNLFHTQITANERGGCLWITSPRGNAYFAAVERHPFTLLPRVITDGRAPIHFCWLGVALSIGRITANNY